MDYEIKIDDSNKLLQDYKKIKMFQSLLRNLENYLEDSLKD